MHETINIIKFNRETLEVFQSFSIILPEPTNLQPIPKIPKEHLTPKQLLSLRLYWQYTENRIFQIYNYISFQTFRLLSKSKVMYAVFDDNPKTDDDQYTQYDCHLIKRIILDKKDPKGKFSLRISSSGKIVKPRQVSLKTGTSSAVGKFGKAHQSILVEDYVAAKFLESVKHGFKLDPIPTEPVDLFPHAPKKRGVNKKDKKDKKASKDKKEKTDKTNKKGKQQK